MQIVSRGVVDNTLRNQSVNIFELPNQMCSKPTADVILFAWEFLVQGVRFVVSLGTAALSRRQLPLRHSTVAAVLRETRNEVPYSPVYSFFPTSVNCFFSFSVVCNSPTRVQAASLRFLGHTQLYRHTQQTQEKNIHDLIWIRTRDHSSRTATGLRVASGSYLYQIFIKLNQKTGVTHFISPLF